MADARLEELRQRKASAEYVAAIRLAQGLLENPEGLSDSEAFEVARIGAGCAMAMKQAWLASRFAQEEIRWAEASGDHDLQAIGAFHYGAALMFIGDAHLAKEQFERFITLDTPQRDALTAMRWAARFNLGVVLEQQRAYHEAIAVFLAARLLAEESGNIGQELQALLEAAWAEILDRRFEAAGYHLEQAGELLQLHPDERLKTTALCHRACYHWKIGELTTAMELCEEVVTPGRPGVTAHHRCEAAWIAGECALALGLFDKAGLLVKVAMDEALQANWTYLMNQVNDLRRRIDAAGEATA